KETFDYDVYDNLKTRDTSWWSSGNGSVHVRGFPSSETEHWSAQYDQNQTGGKSLLSLLRQVDVTSAVPGQPPITRTSLFTPDPNTGLLLDETIQPGGGAARTQNIHYDRNERGQVIHVRATPADTIN